MLIRPTRIFSKAITAGLSSSLLNSHRCRFGSTKSQTGIAKATAAEPILLDESEEDDLEEYLKRIRPYSSINYAAVHPATLERRVLIYDGICSLCHRGVKWIINVDKDRKISFCCLQSRTAEVYLRLCGLTREDVYKRFLFVEGPDSYHQGSTAALRVMSYLPPPYSFLSSLLVIPRPLRDAAYDYVARKRYCWFGKSDNCLVLRDLELLERFVDREELMGRLLRGDKVIDGQYWD